MPLIVVMGASGSGKSTAGALIAEAIGVPFVDADELHPLDNIEKMAAGLPLEDADRWAWLALVGRRLAEAGETGMVMACSALKRSYRDAIVREAPATVFVHLHGSREVLASRLQGRIGHFMPAALLDSQLATLQEPQPDERAVLVNVDAPLTDVVADAVAALRALG
jgi:carbohydrate kinase (thermoresistant glucokinase family)